MIRMPDDRTLTTLEAIIEGKKFEIINDERMLIVTDRGNWEALGEEIDELTKREWIVSVDAKIEATEAGKYWLRRRIKEKFDAAYKERSGRSGVGRTQTMPSRHR